MRKFYSLIAMFLMAMVANAQMITFSADDIVAAGELNGKTFGSGDLTLTVTDLVDGGKVVVDGNNANFGTLESYQGFTHRLKTSGKSSSKNCLAISVAKAGTLNIYARTASSSSERAIVLTKDGTEVFNKIFVDSQAATEKYTTEAGEEKTRTIFPVYSLEVEAGKYDVTYPDGAVNFYAIELVSNAPAGPSITFGETSYSVVATETLEVEAFAETAYQDLQADYSAQLAKMLAAVGLESATTAQLVQVDANGTAFAFDTNDGWHSADGLIEGQGWGNAGGVCVKPWGVVDDAAVINGTISYIGCYDESWKEGTTHTCKFAVINDGKAALLEVTLKFVADPDKPIVEPTPEIAEPTKSLAALNIVKTYDVDAIYYLGKTNEGKTLKFDLEGIYEALDITAEVLDPNIGKVALVQGVVSEGEGDAITYSIGDALVVPAEAAGGAWFGRYVNYNESTGEEEPIYLNMPKTWGTGNNSVYTQQITLNNGEFSFVTGQYGGLITSDSKDYIEYYIINGSKAVKVKVNLKAIAEPLVSFEDWVKVGSETDEIKHILGGAGGSFTLDLAKVAELLGCETGDVAFNILADAESLSNDHTATKGGCWMTKEGYSIPWGQEGYAMYVEPDKDMTFTDFSVGFNDAAWVLGDEYNIKLLFNFAGKYFEKVLNVKIVEKEISGVDPDSNFDIVATIPLNQQIVPSGAYYGNESVEIQLKLQKNLGIDNIKAMIGEGTYKVYGQDAPANANGYPTITSAYTYGANAGYNTGFWMADPVADLGEEYQFNSYAGSWAACPYGIEFDYTNGIIGFDQIPNRQQVGDMFRSVFYWVNTSNNKAIKLVVTVKYVDQYTEESDEEIKPTVETINYALKDEDYNDKEGVFMITLDTQKAMETLGIESADELESISAFAPESEFNYYKFSTDETAFFNETGYYTTEEDKIHITAFISVIDDKLVLGIDPLDLDLTSAETAEKAVIRIGIEFNGKYYMYVVNLSSAATAIESVTLNSNASAKKVMSNGKVVIVKDAKTFSANGARIK